MPHAPEADQTPLLAEPAQYRSALSTAFTYRKAHVAAMSGNCWMMDPLAARVDLGDLGARSDCERPVDADVSMVSS